jgi:hypothetical protein
LAEPPADDFKPEPPKATFASCIARPTMAMLMAGR